MNKINVIAEITKSQIKDILQIQKDLSIGAGLIESGATVAENGMLISGHTEDALYEYIDNGGVIFASRAVGGEIAGYLIVVPGFLFTLKYLTASVRWSAGEDAERMKRLLDKGEFVYLDQIAVRWKDQRTGIATELLEHFERRYAGNEVVVMIMTAPLRNIASIKLFEENGYRKICDIHFDEFGYMENTDNILVHKYLKQTQIS